MSEEELKAIRAEALKKWREEGEEKKTYREKFEEKPTRPLAIKIKCIDCMGGEEEPGYRQLIKECSSHGCSLREFRPYK